MIVNQITPQNGTMGVRAMPDNLDSGSCHLRDGKPAVVRLNLDGVYTSLCVDHRNSLVVMLAGPAPAPAHPSTEYA